MVQGDPLWEAVSLGTSVAHTRSRLPPGLGGLALKPRDLAWSPGWNVRRLSLSEGT